MNTTEMLAYLKEMVASQGTQAGMYMLTLSTEVGTSQMVFTPTEP